MFERFKEKRRARKLEDILHERILEAEKLFKAEDRRFLIWKSRQTTNPLELRKIAIKGVSRAMKAGISGALPPTLIYGVAAKVGLDAFEEYFDKTFVGSQTPHRSAGDGLSYYLVKNADVAARYKASVAVMRHHVQATIYAVAEFIELQGISVQTARLKDIEPSKQRQIATFVDAQHQWRTSYRSMAAALSLFVRENADIVRRIETARRTRSEDTRRLFQLNAVFGYEVADVTIGFLKAFELQGIPELRRLHDEIMSEVERGRTQVNALEAEVTSAHRRGAITEERFIQSLNSIAGRRRALDLIQRQWKGLLQKLDQSERNSSRFSNIIQKLEIIKLEAEANLTVSGLVDVTGAVQENFAALGDMIKDVDDLEIVPITDEEVSLFLNIPLDGQDNLPEVIGER